jgi:hypothetical protein
MKLPFLAPLLILSITSLCASDRLTEIPLGTTMTVFEETYGKPVPHPIYTIIGKAPTKEDLANCFEYRRLSPPRFYQFSQGQAVSVHYYDLSGKDMDFVEYLLSIHAKNQDITEVDPKTLGHDPAGLGTARAWTCPSLKWTGLYRAYKDTSPSLYIY